MVVPDKITVKCIQDIANGKQFKKDCIYEGCINDKSEFYIVESPTCEEDWKLIYDVNEKTNKIEINSSYFEIIEDAKEDIEQVSELDKVLEQRGNRYGDFKFHAEIACELKDSLNTKELPTYYMREAADMICHKLARIANGDPYYVDSWVDIAGYAQLVVDILNEIEGEKI